MRALFIIDNGDGSVRVEREPSWNTPDNKPNQLAKFDMDRDALPDIPDGPGLTWDGTALHPASQEWIDAQAAAAEAAEAEQLAGLASKIGGMVSLLRMRLVQLGHDLPGDSTAILGDVMGRSAAGTLDETQDRAMSKLADLYLILRGQDITDDQINAVWQYLQAQQ